MLSQKMTVPPVSCSQSRNAAKGERIFRSPFALFCGKDRNLTDKEKKIADKYVGKINSLLFIKVMRNARTAKVINFFVHLQNDIDFAKNYFILYYNSLKQGNETLSSEITFRR